MTDGVPLRRTGSASLPIIFQDQAYG